MHPYCPFITEEIWSHSNDTLLINSKWPVSDQHKINPKVEKEISIIKNVISSIRNIKANFSISPKKEISLICKVDSKTSDIISEYKSYLERLVKVTDLQFGEDIDKPSQATTIVVNEMEIYIPLKGLIDIDKEVDRLNSQIENLQGRLAAVNKKINNKQFIANAPPTVVEHERNKQNRYENELKILEDNLNSLV